MMSETRSEAKPCKVCKFVTSKKCSGCKLVHYCSKEHQKADWKRHSQGCKSYKLVENEKLGRHYVAQRRIESGEVVIKESTALVTGPQQVSVPVCLGCGVPLTAKTANPCPECGWPLCPRCSSHGDECDFTRRYKGAKVAISGFGMAHPTYKCITVVRALALRDVDPSAYAKFTRLSSSCGDLEEPRAIARFVKRFFDKLDDFREDEVARAAGILQINGHEVPVTEPSQMAVYDASSYLEHSCRANCSKSFTESGGLLVRAARTIEKGDHITICYTDPLWGTVNRRHHLSRTKFFDCTCQRCSDPTEFGSMFNAIKCLQPDCNGYMLPRSFTGPDVPSYGCDRCDRRVSSNEVDDTTERIGRDLTTMKKNDANACRDFLHRYSSVLHENHYYMTDVKLALAQIIGQQEGVYLPYLDSEVIGEKILLCKKLNELLGLIVPAENRVRGLVLFEMHAAVAEFARRQEKEHLYGILLEAKKLLKEAYELLKVEPEILPEGKIARTAKQNLTEMEMILKTLCQSAATPL